MHSHVNVRDRDYHSNQGMITVRRAGHWRRRLAPLWVVTRRRCRRECRGGPWRGVRLHARIRRRVWAAARARGANVSTAVILAAPALRRLPAHVTKGRAERAVLNVCGALDTLVCPSPAVGRGHAPRTAVGLACVGPYCHWIAPLAGHES